MEERVKRLRKGREDRDIRLVCNIARESMHGKYKHNTSMMSLTRMDV